MSKRESRRKSFYYKRATFQDLNLDLEHSLRSILKEFHSIGKRKETFGKDENYIRVILDHNATDDTMLFGVLAGLEKDTHQPAISDDDNAETLSIKQIAPTKDDDNKKMDFIEGLCFFGIKENHVVIMPSRALNSAALEAHINYLINKANFSNIKKVSLADHFSKEISEKIKEYGVKKINFGADLNSPVPHYDTDQLEEIPIGTKFFTLLTDMLGNNSSGLNLQESLKGDIKFVLSIKHNRSPGKESLLFMEQIANAFRNIEGDIFSLELGKGFKVKGDLLRISRSFNILTISGIPETADVYKKMKDWLHSLLVENLID